MRRPGRSCSKAEAAIVVLLALGLGGCGGAAAPDLASVPTDVARRGPMRVMVKEGGDLASAQPVSVRNEVEGRTTIIELIPEGTPVQKGDLIARLDTSELVDKLNRAQIDVDRAKSELVQAREALAIQLKKNIEARKDADTQLALAKNAFDAYVGTIGPEGSQGADGEGSGGAEGTYAIERRELLSKILIAEEQKKRAKDKLDGSERLYAKKFLSKTELDADALAFTQAEEELKIARDRLEQLDTWTRPAEILKLESSLDVATLALERVIQQNASEQKQCEDSVATRERSLRLEEEARDKLTAMIEKATIRAPCDGLVVYSRGEQRGGMRGGSQPMEVGKELREREEIVQIPDLSRMVVEVDIHESAIKKVGRGQPCLVRVDAIPGRAFRGVVASVSPVPSTSSSWMNPDLKVYTTLVRLEEHAPEMKPGMNAQVDILIADLPEAVQVPLQAVKESGDRAFAYLKHGDKVELREVEVGLANDAYVQVTKGLEEGDVVFLTKPPGATPLPAPAPPAMPASGTPATPASPEGAPAEGPAAAGAEPASAAAPGEAGRPADSRRRGPPMTEEQRKAWQERMKNMTPEEREAFRRRREGRAEQENE